MKYLWRARLDIRFLFIFASIPLCLDCAIHRHNDCDHSTTMFELGTVLKATTGRTISGCIPPHDNLGILDYARLLGIGGASTQSYGIAIDSTGNIYIAGITNGNLGGQTFTGATGGANNNLFLSRYDSQGNRLWTRLLGASAADTEALAVTTDSAGGIYLTGKTTGSIGGQAAPAGTGMFTAKYDLNGNLLWTRVITSIVGYYATSYGIGADALGNIYSGGFTNNTFDSHPLITGGAADSYVVKYDSNGNELTSWVFGGPANVYGFGFAANSFGNIHATGYTQGNLFGQTFIGSSPNKNFFLVKFDTNGNQLWTQLLGSVSAGTEAYGYGITVDAFGNIYTAGNANVSIGGQVYSGGGLTYYDLLVTKYDPNGNLLWVRMLGTPGGNVKGNSITVDFLGNVYATGFTSASLDGQPFSGGTYDLFVVKYDANGNKKWTKLLGAGANTNATGISVDFPGNVYGTGYTSASLLGQPYSGGTDDSFLIKYE
ncbi:SBBP repeat-containing protein [Leptospira broomii]|nr:SBBP repeat-containing protein [Leptospira broomii]